VTGTDETNLRRVRYDDVEFDDQLALVDGMPFTGIIFDQFPDGRTAKVPRRGDNLRRLALPTDGYDFKVFRLDMGCPIRVAVML
jgi:hypothetical protein